MPKSYTSNFIKIYLWQTLSIVLNFASMFIVTPLLTGKPAIYGIYMLCISLTIFLAYADLGFISAGSKYASENIAQKDYSEATRVTGFVLFILLVAVIPLFAIFVLFSCHPTLLIKDLHDSQQLAVASRLLLILALFAPVGAIGQRFLQLVYGTRLEDYLYQRINILGNSLKIASVFYFFTAGRYDIVGYFLFCQIISLLCIAIAAFLAKKRYKYDFLLLLKSLRFSKKIFERSKSLAFASLFGTIAWVLYYELDSMAISKFLGPVPLAFYAIGITINSFLRTIFGTVFQPFSTRFNHYIGLRDIEGLKQVYLRSIRATLPLSVFLVLSILLLLKPLVYCWVGPKYDASIVLSFFILLGYLFASISYPTQFIMVAQVRTTIMNTLSSFTVIASWGTILILLSKFGVLAFAAGKCVALAGTGVAYIVLSKRYLKLSHYSYVKDIVLPIVPSICFIVVFLFCSSRFLPIEKGKIHLLYVLLTGGAATCGATVIYYLVARDFRKLADQTVLNKIKDWLPLKSGTENSTI